jgi:dienelactone hydrolase
MEKNVGKGFEARLATGDSDGGATCATVIASFGEDPKESAPLQDTKGIDFALYTVYRPAQLQEGEKLPVITWGNGTCAKPEGYGALLRYVASHGFFVIAANSRWTQTGAPMTKALDYLKAANADAKSPYYQHLDLARIGAMGHSQGGMATIEAAADARVKTVIIWNGGSSASKPYLAVTGDQDIGDPTVAGLKRDVEASPPGAWLFYHKTVGTGSVKGHLTLMTQPERVVEPAVAWFKYQLSSDAASRDWFVGSACKLCTTTDEYEYGQKGLP